MKLNACVSLAIAMQWCLPRVLLSLCAQSLGASYTEVRQRHIPTVVHVCGMCGHASGAKVVSHPVGVLQPLHDPHLLG